MYEFTAPDGYAFDPWEINGEPAEENAAVITGSVTATAVYALAE